MRRLALLLTLAACRPAPEPSLPICPALVTAARADEADTRVLPPDLWFALLVPGFERETGTPPDDPHDCSRRDIFDPDEDPTDTPALPPRPRTPDDLSFGTLNNNNNDDSLLVWARLRDYPDGTAAGPVVLVRWISHGLEIRGVGSLRAPSRRARLHLEHLQGGHALLIAEGEACPVDPTCITCPSGQVPCPREGEACPLDPACTTCPSGQVPCPREAVLLPLVDQRFLSADIIEGERDPRPARLRLDERRDLRRPDGTTRRLEIRRRIDLHGASPSLHAAIRIRDCAPGLPCDDHLTLVDARPLGLSGLTFVTPEDPWQTLLAQQSTRTMQ